jgi:hypothetical protein
MNRPFHSRQTIDWWCDMHRHLGDGARLNRDEVATAWNKYRWGDHPRDAARAILAERSELRREQLSGRR